MFYIIKVVFFFLKFSKSCRYCSCLWCPGGWYASAAPTSSLQMRWGRKQVAVVSKRKSGCRSLHAQETRQLNQHIVHYHCVDPHVLKIDHQREQRKRVCAGVYAFTCTYQLACTPLPCCICVWWISWRNAVALDHFNHFLLYLWQLLGEVEITVWHCFDAFPLLTAPNKGETHMLCPRAFRLQGYRQPCDVGPSLRSNH